MRTWFQKNAEYVGWFAVWLFIGFFLCMTTIEVMAEFTLNELPLQYIAPFKLVIYDVLFLLFLYGIRGFAIRVSDPNLVKTMNSLMLLSFFEMLFFLPYAFSLFVEPNFLTILLTATIPLFCVNGILLLRLADNFGSHVESFGVPAKRIVLWNKIAGWMMASVVLILPGIIVSLVGEFFLWRLLARSRKQTVVAAV